MALSLFALALCLRVILSEGEWWLDLPELTSIRLGKDAFCFDDASSELIMRSCDDNGKWWLDLPKLTSLTTVEDSLTFTNPRSIILEGSSYDLNLTNRHTLSHHCCSFQGICFQMEEDYGWMEFLFHASLIPSHHPRSFCLSQVSSFFHTQFTTISHFTTQYSPQPIRRFHSTQQQTPFPPSISLFGLVRSSLYDYAE